MMAPTFDPLALDKAAETYWGFFAQCLRYRISTSAWTPLQVLKIFKLGLHWVLLFRKPGECGPNPHVTYWVVDTWDTARAKASEIAAPIRQDFEAKHGRAN